MGQLALDGSCQGWRAVINGDGRLWGAGRAPPHLPSWPARNLRLGLCRHAPSRAPVCAWLCCAFELQATCSDVGNLKNTMHEMSESVVVQICNL